MSPPASLEYVVLGYVVSICRALLSVYKASLLLGVYKAPLSEYRDRWSVNRTLLSVCRAHLGVHAEYRAHLNVHAALFEST